MERRVVRVKKGNTEIKESATEFKEARRRFRRAIERCKEEWWKEFCATLNQDTCVRPYRVVKAIMARNIPPEDLSKDRVAKILENIFVIKRAEQKEEEHSSQIPQKQTEEEQDLRATKEDLRTAIVKCDPSNAAGVAGYIRAAI